MATHVDVFELFEDVWRKFQKFVIENIRLLNDAEKEILFVKAISKQPELALIVMKSNLPLYADQIHAKDVDFFIKTFGNAVGITQLTIPQEVSDKGFLFGQVFLKILQEIQV